MELKCKTTDAKVCLCRETSFTAECPAGWSESKSSAPVRKILEDKSEESFGVSLRAGRHPFPLPAPPGEVVYVYSGGGDPGVCVCVCAVTVYVFHPIP